MRYWLAFLLLGALCSCQTKDAVTGEETGLDSAGYEFRTPSENGIGKVYMGREIAKVMGHQAADWLERPEREQEERTDKLVAGMELQPDDVVADIGAGSGYFTFRMAKLVPEGRVFAVDIQPEMLSLMEEKRLAEQITNVTTVLGTETDPRLPTDSVDVVLLVDVYHEFSHPREMMIALRNSLKTGGRVVLVEYRAEEAWVNIKPIHKMSAKAARQEMEAVGLKFVRNRKFLPQQHFLIFEKP